MSRIEVCYTPDWKSLKAAVHVVEELEENILVESIEVNASDNFIKVVLK